MKAKLYHRYLFFSGFIFISVLSSMGQDPRPGIECGCDKYDNYKEPSSKGILVEQGTTVQEGSSSKGKYIIEVVDANPPNVVNITVFYQGKMIFNESNRATGWGFSPDEDKFVMHGLDFSGNHWCRLVNLDPDPSKEGEQAVVFFVIPPMNVSSSNIRFSPNGKYLLYAAVSGTTGGLFLNVFNTRTGQVVYDGSVFNLVGSPAGKSVAGWGFSPDKKDATFVHAYLTDVDRYTLIVKNLSSPAGNYIVQATNMQGEAQWFFSPCGDYFGWIIDSPYSGLECRLYNTNMENTYQSVSAEYWWKLYSAADGHYIRYKDNSTQKIADNTADETCPDKTKPTWENALLDTGLVEGTTMELEWKGATDNVEVTAYKIFKDGKLFKEVEAVKNYTVTGLKPSTRYKFRIEAGDEAGNWSTNGPVDSFPTFPDNPPFWTDLTLISKNITETRVGLQWKAASDDYGVTSYKVLVNGDEAGKVGCDTLKFTIRGLTAGSKDTFTIVAGDAANHWTTGPALILDMPPPAPPYWPTGAELSDTNVTETSMTIRWPAALDQFNAVTRYKISMNGNFLTTKVAYDRELKIDNLEEGTVYSFEVIACDESDNESVPLTGMLSTLTGFVVSPLITDPSNQKFPDISGNLVVWWDDRNDEGDIYSYYLINDSMSRVTADPDVQFEPAVDGQRIVWTDRRNGNYDIYMYDPVLGEMPICTADGAQDLPAIDGDIIVWRDERNGNYDIYMYDLSKMQESPVITRSSNQNWPDVSGYYVVYADDRNEDWDIYMTNIVSKKEYTISTGWHDQTFPVITGRYGYRLAVAYNDASQMNDITVYYPFMFLDNGYEFRLDLDPDPVISTQLYPHLEDKQLVYQDMYPVSDGVTYSIWAYQQQRSYPNSRVDKIKLISSEYMRNQTWPRTSQGNIVWQYDKGTDTDLYVMKRAPGSDLQLTLAKNHNPAMVGDTLKYYLTAVNDGPNNNMFIETRCNVPQLAKFVSALTDKGEVTMEGKSITWKIDSLKYLSEATLTISMVTYEVALLDFGASINGGAFDPDPSNNEIHDTTKVKNSVARIIDLGDTPAMVVEDNGKIHLAYFRKDSIIYASKVRKGTWQHRVLGYCPDSKYIAMVMSADSNMHIVYSDYIMNVIPGPGKKSLEASEAEENYNDEPLPETLISRLYYGVLSKDGEWNSRIIALSDTGFHSLSLDCTTDNELYLAFQQAGGVANPGPFKVMKTMNGIWQPAKTIFQDGYDHIDLKLDSENNLHLSFYNISQGSGILYQKWTNDLSGPVEQIEPRWLGGQMEGMVTSVVTDNMNQPHISYVGSVHDDHMENIKHAWKKDGQWHTEKVDDGSFGSVGHQVAPDPTGAIDFGYIHMKNNELRFATNVAGPWIRQVVDISEEGPFYYDAPPGAFPVLPQILWGEVEFDMDNYRNGHMALSGIYGIQYALIPPVDYFTVDPDSIDFGAVQPDSTKTLVLTMTNPSMKDIRIDNISTNDERFTFSRTSFVLNKQDDDTVAISFTQSSQATKVNTYITITYNSPSGLKMDIPVRVRGWHPELSVSAELLDFMAVPKYTMQTKTVTLQNTGPVELIISKVEVKYELFPGYVWPTDFSLAGHNCTTLQSGETCEVQVGFQPNKDGDQYSYLNITSNDPETPLKKVSLYGNTPYAAIRPGMSELDLGYSPISQTRSKTLKIYNYGSDILNITSVNLSGTDMDQFSFTNSCTSVNSGDSCMIEVSMTPTRSADFQATMVINSNSQWSKNLYIPLTGSSILRTLELSTGVINFGNIHVGEKTSYLLELRNNGTTDVTVSSISSISGADRFEFKHSYSSGACYSIPPGSVCIDTVWFIPIFEGSKTACFTVNSNDSYQPEQTVTLTGLVGTPLPLQAGINANPQDGIVPLAIQFTSNVTGGQPPYQYFWDFRDGSTSTVPSPTHEFILPGKYRVIFTVSDINMQSVKDSVEIVAASQSVPLVVISAQPASGYIPLTVQFEAIITGGDAPVSVLWDFDDGSLNQNPNPVHGFSFPGKYNVKVTVTDADGDIAMDSVIITAMKKISMEGNIRTPEGGYVQKSRAILYPENWPAGMDTLRLNQEYMYRFEDIDSGKYTVLIIPDTVEYADYLPTYLGNTLLLSDALWVLVDNVVSGKDIYIENKPANPEGSGTIEGTFIQGEGGKKIAVTLQSGIKAGSGISNCYVFLKDAMSGDLEAFDITRSNGGFIFDSLLTGAYLFEADYLGLSMDPANATLELLAEDDSLEILATAGISKITIELVETGLIDPASNENIRIYPVPAGDRLVVEISKDAFPNGIARVSIYDINGKHLMAEYPFISGEKLLELDISGLADGFYLLRIEDGMYVYEIRFIKTN